MLRQVSNNMDPQSAGGGGGGGVVVGGGGVEAALKRVAVAAWRPVPQSFFFVFFYMWWLPHVCIGWLEQASDGLVMGWFSLGQNCLLHVQRSCRHHWPSFVQSQQHDVPLTSPPTRHPHRSSCSITAVVSPWLRPISTAPTPAAPRSRCPNPPCTYPVGHLSRARPQHTPAWAGPRPAPWVAAAWPQPCPPSTPPAWGEATAWGLPLACHRQPMGPYCHSGT